MALTAIAVPMISSAPAKTRYVRIGLEGPLTGSQASVGIGMLRGAQLAADFVNHHGGIVGPNGRRGWQIHIVPIDDAANPVTGMAAAKRAIKSGLNGVVGPYNSGVGARTLPLYLKAGLTPFRLTSANQTSGLGATLQPMTYQIAPVATKALTTWLKAHSVAIIFDHAVGYTSAEAASVKNELIAVGVTVSEFPISEGIGDYTAAVTAAAATHPTVIYTVAYYAEAGLLAREIAAAHTGARCLADYGAYDSAYVTVAGVSAAQACPVVGVPAPEAFAGSAPYVKQYQKRFRAAPGTWSPYTYDSLRMFTYVVNTTHSYRQKVLERVLPKVKGYHGWTGHINIAPKTLDRTPATVVVNGVTPGGAFVIDPAWAAAVGYTG